MKQRLSKYLRADLTPNTTQKLPQAAGWRETCHVFDQESLDAIEASVAAQRPLLIRGEPGTGKSQLARAAAACAVGHPRTLIPEVVHARSESSDLLWRFDAVGRLGEAQAIGAAQGHGTRRFERFGRYGERALRERMDASRFLQPGPLWWAFDWPSALEQHQRAARNLRAPQPECPKGWRPEHGCVVLIDEIDKADADLPNGLLETLGEGKFSVPHRGMTLCQNPDLPTPLVVITTNEERELPPAFVRRCFVLHLRLPDEDPSCTEQAKYYRGGGYAEEFLDDAVADFLVRRGQAHFGEEIAPDVYGKAAELLCEDRRRAHGQGLPRPGQAEYIDLLRALRELAPQDEVRQLEYLNRIARFALQKFDIRS